MLRPEKIITLWAVFLLMPLFHGLNVVQSEAQNISEIASILWLMLGFFAIPMILVIATLFYESRRYRKIHFCITILYSVLNLMHVIADLFVQPIAWYQIALMVFLFLVGLLLNLVSFQWIKERQHQSTQQQPIAF